MYIVYYIYTRHNLTTQLKTTVSFGKHMYGTPFPSTNINHP